jgi:hypothetical protein
MKRGLAGGLGRFGAVAALAVLAVALTACEPPPPRLVLTVTGAGAEPDTNPGDGICEAVDRLGFRGCTLRAAIDEANATTGGVDILLPGGAVGGVTATITGDVVLKPASTGRSFLKGVHLTVAAGARVRAERLETDTFISSNFQVNLDVYGTLVLDRSLVISADPFLTDPSPDPALRIRSGGVALVTDSVLISDAPDGTVANAGTLLAARSTVSGTQGCSGCQARAVVTATGAVSHLQSSGLHTTLGASGYSACAGVPPVSQGWLHLEQPCGTVPATGDSTGAAGWTIDPGNHLVAIDPASPLVDAVPLGAAGCEVTAVDVFGAPRGVDGDGDGVGGCDIGAVERQP